MVADAAAAIKAAAEKIGKPYVWGATGPNAFDCSGLTSWAWRAGGVELPRTSQAQATFGTPVRRVEDLRPGDLVTSDWGSGPSSHVALYVGDGRLIHAPRPGRTVTYAKLDSTYRSKINAMRRVPGVKGGKERPGTDAASWWDPLNLGDMLEFGAGKGAGGVMEAVGVGAAALKSVAQSAASVGALATFLLKLALPSTWVRIVCGVLGAVVLLLGIGFLVRETRGA